MFKFHPVFFCRRAHQHVTLRIGNHLRAVERPAHVLDELLSGSSATLGFGPFKTFAAATRSSFNADKQRANTASPINVTGMPKSSALMAVHLPVPFLPGGVEDLVDQRLCRPSSFLAKISLVISIR